MLAEILYWSSFGLLKKRDFRKGVVEQQMFFMGYKALPIVGLLSFLIGVVLALQAAFQLEQFGAGIFLAPMIAISMIKEFGPLLTAVILTGRTRQRDHRGNRHHGRWRGSRRLENNGNQSDPIYRGAETFCPHHNHAAAFRAVPRCIGMFGGYLVAVFYLKIASGLFISELMKNVVLNDVMANIVKSIVFSWLIIWVGSFHGFRVKGGAEEVGRETTASVVNGIFIIIVADAAFSFIFS